MCVQVSTVFVQKLYNLVAIIMLGNVGKFTLPAIPACANRCLELEISVKDGVELLLAI